MTKKLIFVEMPPNVFRDIKGVDFIGDLPRDVRTDYYEVPGGTGGEWQPYVIIVVLSGLISNIAGGFLQAIGEDIWIGLKEHARKYVKLYKSKTHFPKDFQFFLRIRLEDCDIKIEISGRGEKIKDEVFDHIEELISVLAADGRESESRDNLFYLRNVHYSKIFRKWNVDLVVDKDRKKVYSKKQLDKESRYIFEEIENDEMNMQNFIDQMNNNADDD